MLWAVHISDGVLAVPWLVGGFVVAAVLWVGAVFIDVVLDALKRRRFREEEIAEVALLTAAFFVASLVHVRVGPTSVHLLLNGLVGVILGWRAALAIPVGLFLQAALLGHGGFTTLGVNSCVMTFPALLAWALFNGLRRLPFLRNPAFRATLVMVSVLAWTLSLVFSIALLTTNRPGHLAYLDTAWASAVTCHPAILCAALLLALLAARLERRLGNPPEFALGLLVGEVAVLATMLLNAAVLVWGGEEDWHTLALVVFVAHLPIAVIEGVVLGFAVGFLARVKPELLGWTGPVDPACSSNDPTLVNGRIAHAPSFSLVAAPEFSGHPQPVRPGQGAPP